MTALRPLTTLAPVAAAVALFVAGCGGGSGVSKNDYVKDLNEAVASLQKSTSSLTPEAATSGGAAVKQLESGGQAMDVAAENFNNITPPDDAEHAHGQIVDGLHKLADTFRDAADAARSKDSDKLVKLLQGIQDTPGAKELQAATEELAAKGYNVQ